MNVRKEFLLPLIPALTEVVIRIFIVNGGRWYEYFNAGSFIITFSIWSVAATINVNTNNLIPTDSSVIKHITGTRSNLLIVSVFGFIIFGIWSLVEAVTGRWNIAPQNDVLKNMISIFSVCYVIVSSSYIYLDRTRIQKYIYGEV